MPASVKKKRRKILSGETWIKIRFLWECDQATFKQLSDMFAVPVASIKRRSHVENWTRHGLKQKIEEKIKEDTVAMLARLGMPKEEFLKLIIAGAKETQCMKNVKRVYKDDAGKVVMAGQKPLTLEQTVSAIDNDNTLRHRELLAKLAGWAAAPKAPVADKEDGEAEIPVVPYIKRKEPK